MRTEIEDLIIKSDTKIIMIVLDGLGGLPGKEGFTELEAAQTPNMDKLAAGGTCGLSEPIAAGVTPGSGPSHFALFGYDPFATQIGRGVLEALGIGMKLTENDLPARANFATIDAAGLVTDRRAGRIPTEKNKELCELLQSKIATIDDIKVTIKPVKEHRFVVMFSGVGLGGSLTESDPQKEGRPLSKIEALDETSGKSADVVNEFIARALEVLKDEHPANALLMRGIAKPPSIPSMKERFKLATAAIATYPTYKGLAKLVGMEILDGGDTIQDEIECLKNNYKKHDFFYFHVKKTDSRGEDGDFDEKVKVIEEFDKKLPEIVSLQPAVIAITSDHSTPCRLKGHSWHPNPFLLASDTCLPDRTKTFSERECVCGGLGRFPAEDAIALMLAHSLKMKKYGA